MPDHAYWVLRTRRILTSTIALLLLGLAAPVCQPDREIHKTAILLFEYSDIPLNVDQEALYAALDANRRYFLQVSRGRVLFRGVERSARGGDVLGPFLLDYPTTCHSFLEINELIHRVDPYVDFSQYTDIAVAGHLPVGVNCGFAAGEALISKRAFDTDDGRVYLNLTNYDVGWIPNPGVLMHEFAHNFGLTHANAFDECTDWFDYWECVFVELGDSTSVLGYTFDVGSLSAFHKDGLGWFGPSLEEVWSTGDYEIFAYEQNHAPIALKIPRYPLGYRPDRVDGIQAQSFYVELRTDTYPNRRVAPGVYIHLDENLVNPKNVELNGNRLVGAALDVGESFYDPASNVRITLLSQEEVPEEKAIIRVERDEILFRDPPQAFFPEDHIDIRTHGYHFLDRVRVGVVDSSKVMNGTLFVNRENSAGWTVLSVDPVAIGPDLMEFSGLVPQAVFLGQFGRGLGDPLAIKVVLEYEGGFYESIQQPFDIELEELLVY